MDGTTAQAIYREEKARAMQERRISHAQLMAEAKEAFAKMLADAQLARKGGRPKSNPNAPGAAAAAKAKLAPPPAVAAAPVAAKKAASVKEPAKVSVGKAGSKPATAPAIA